MKTETDLFPALYFFGGIKKVKLHKTKKKDRAIWYSRSKIKLSKLWKKKLTFLDAIGENLLFFSKSCHFFFVLGVSIWCFCKTFSRHFFFGCQKKIRQIV